MAQTATVQIQMPEMGESVTEGIVLEWHVAEGDTVSEGDTVVEVSTDKIDAEVPAPADGVITKLLASVDDEVKVGQPLAEMEATGEVNPDSPALGGTSNGEGPGAEPAGPVDAGDPPPPARQEGVPPTTPPAGEAASSEGSEGGADGGGQALTIQMPEMGESVSSGVVLEWHVAEGDTVSEGDTVVEVSTDKIDAEVPAPADGVITKLLASVDDEVKVGQPLAEMEATGEVNPDSPALGGTSNGEGPGAEPAGPVDAGDPPPPARQEGVPPTTPPAGEAASSEGSEGGADGGGQALTIQMPEMGESVSSGVVLEWHVAEGDTVSEGDTVVEVSTDKIDAEVPAPADGVITKLLASVDDEVKVGQPLAEMEATGEVNPDSPALGGTSNGEGPGAEPAGPVDAGDPPPPARQEGVPPTTPPAGEAGNHHGIQRIGLSATQRPLERIGQFLVGPKRECRIVDAGQKKALDLEIVVPVEDMADPGAPAYPSEGGPPPSEVEPSAHARSIWPAIYPRLLELVQEHTSTMIFVNNRRAAERLAKRLNELANGEGEQELPATEHAGHARGEDASASP